MKYWWVSQGDYFEKELIGGYLWVPIAHKSGKKIHHWERIKDLKNGDFVFSYVNQSIVAVSKVIREFYIANRPIPMPERDVINEGFMVDLKYNPIAKPLKIYQIVDDLQQILSKQTRYKPLNKNGHGNQGYIFPLSDKAGEYILRKTGFDS